MTRSSGEDVRPAAGDQPMRADSVVLSARELERVRAQVSEFDWYGRILERFRQRVEELILRAPQVPLAKGRAFYESCPDDHAQLIFDPYRPTSHVCPRCGRDWQGEEFDLSWVRQFQDWLGKRLVEAGILYRLEGDERHAKLVRDSLAHFVRHYHDYPLANNLLGPTRLFQSTYLEAFWLVDMVASYDLTKSSPAYGVDDHSGVRDLLYESSDIVRSFDEGVSNRQAFNNTGMGAVALLYEDEALLGHVLRGRHGFAFHMRESLLEDGIWYEGETYHFATLDHSLNLAEMARHRGVDLYEGTSGIGSLRPMFEGPLRVMLPDLTFPSRKDSWFGRGIGYHRNVFEMGFARYGDERYGGLLAHAYANGADREDVTWRTFLYLEPRLPELSVDLLRSKRSYAMPGTGLGVLREDAGATYAGLEYGHYGGGHGHPDRLNLTLFAGGLHWLPDPGTGWYHVKELGWYRSSLAHNTVMVGGSNQDQSEGDLTAFGAAAGLSVAQGRVSGAYPDATMRRTLGLGDGFLLDVVEVDTDGKQPVDLTLNVRGEMALDDETEAADAPLSARGGHAFLRDLRRVTGSAEGSDATVRFQGRTLRILQQGADELYVGTGPGIPLHEDVPVNTLIARSTGDRASFTTAYVWDAGEEASLIGTVDRTSATEPPAPASPRSHEARLRLGDRWLRLQVDERPGAALGEEHDDGRLRVAWFGREHVALGGVEVTCLRPLEAAGLSWQDEVLSVELPDDFVRLRIAGGPVPSRVEGLPDGATWRDDEGVLMLEQARAVSLWTTAPTPVRLSAGLQGGIDVQVARHGQERQERADAPVVSAPSDWTVGTAELASSADGVENWHLPVLAPIAEASDRTVEVRCGGAWITLEVQVRPPVSTALDVTSVDGTPALALRVADEAGVTGHLWAELSAPWATRSPRLLASELGAAGRVELALPLPTTPLPATAQEAFGRLGTQVQLPTSATSDVGDNTGSIGGENAGDYFVDAVVRRTAPRGGEYAGAARFRFPLAWARRRDTGRPIPRVGALTLDRPEQAYWAEEPWEGPDGASAEAVLEWDEEALYLRARVRDDRHVADANDEDLYENDSLQLYLDFRPRGRRDSTFSPGVAAYIFAPDADVDRVRVEPIAGSRELANRGLAAPWFTAAGVLARCRSLGRGYELDVTMPFTSLGTGPLAVGDVFRADLSLSDNDGSWYRTHQLVWSGARGYRRCYLRWAYQDPLGYGWVIVSDE